MTSLCDDDAGFNPADLPPPPDDFFDQPPPPPPPPPPPRRPTLPFDIPPPLGPLQLDSVKLRLRTAAAPSSNASPMLVLPYKPPRSSSLSLSCYYRNCSSSSSSNSLGAAGRRASGQQGIDPSLKNGYGQTARDVVGRETPHARELHQMLSERLSAVEATATRDFCDLAEPRSIAFRRGERLTVLERSGDTWKGYVTSEGLSRAGYFPAAAVQLLAMGQQQPPQPPHQPSSMAQRPPPGPAGGRGAPPPSIHSAGAYHQCHHDGLVPCAIPQPPTDPGGGNRNSAASLDSGRSSSHTATSSDTARTSNGGGCDGNGSVFGGTAAASASTAVPSKASEGAATASAGTAGPPRAAGGSQDSGLGPRQSIVSNCSSSGSLGSLPDDSASVSSAGDHQQQPQERAYQPDEWHRAGLTSDQQLARFLNSCQFGLYLGNFQEAGYDLATLVRCTPEDLNAVGLTNPKHRKRLRHELDNLLVAMRSAGLPDPIDEVVDDVVQAGGIDDVGAFCRRLGLPDAAAECLRGQGFSEVRDLAQMAWEDLEEIGISRLGHQKKLMLAIDRLKRPRCSRQQQQQQQQQQKHAPAISCGTCTTTDVIIHPAPSYSADSQVQPTRTVTFALPTGIAASRRCHSDYLLSRSSETATTISSGYPSETQHQQQQYQKPVAKILGRPVPPVPATETAIATAATAKVPPPPPKRVTSVRQIATLRDPSPGLQQQQQPRGNVGASANYENAGLVCESAVRHQMGLLRSTCTRSNSAASVASIPFANENCGTIVRHKQQQQQMLATPPSRQQQQLGTAVAAGAGPGSAHSPALARRGVPVAGGSQAKGSVGPRPPPAPPQQLQPPTRDDSFSNLDDICDMLSDLQSMLDRELQEHQPQHQPQHQHQQQG